MMKRFYLSLFPMLLALAVLANPIDRETARVVANNFFKNLPISSKKSFSELTLVYESKALNGNKKSDQLNAYFYVFNAAEGGYVVVSGDDSAQPILAFSEQGVFDYDSMPHGAKGFLENYKAQIAHLASTATPQAETVQVKWTELKNGAVSQKKNETESVEPLLTTRWGQGQFYNDMCPYDVDFAKNAVTGCPATAMAQIMKYWNYPQQGVGFHSYMENDYGLLSANFGSTSYKWSEMPDVANSQNDAIATLMYHCGVSVEMNYSANISGSYVIKDGYPDNKTVENALIKFFGYDPSLRGIRRADFTTEEWCNILWNELNEGRPVQYAGSYSTSGHTWVCDGYAGYYFSMNWGWDGDHNSYFLLDDLSPGSGGVGSGNGTYNYNQQAIVGIKPLDNNAPYNLQLASDITPSQTIVSFNSPFSISVDVLNESDYAFIGDFAAALWDEQGRFVDYLEIKENLSLQSQDNTGSLVFNTNGLAAALPGKYRVSILYRSVGGEWRTVKSMRLYDVPLMDEYVELTIINENPIQLYSSITLSSNPIVKGNSFDVNFDIANVSALEFSGSLAVALYDLHGDFVASVADQSNIRLGSGMHFTNGLTFSVANLDVEPGEYLMTVLHQWDGYTPELTGSTADYLNPLRVTVKAPPFVADQYEENNEAVDAANLPIGFVGNNATVTTEGANAHLVNDFDFYQIELDAGYNYSFYAQLFDNLNPDGVESYSLDGLFAYSTDGIVWSETFEDAMSQSVYIEGLQTLYFAVAPSYLGFTGTYRLAVDIERTRIVTNVTEIAKSDFKISIFPNPASDFVTLEVDNSPLDAVRIFDCSGKLILSRKYDKCSKAQIPIRNLKRGSYIVSVLSKGKAKDSMIFVK